MHSTKAMRQSWHSHLNLNRKTISAAIILTGLLAAIYFSMGNINRISPSEAVEMTPKELQSVVGTRFGNLFVLRGINILHKNEGVTINLAWESLVTQKLVYTNAIHLTDANGKILVRADYKQPMSRVSLKPGTIWKESIFISKDRLKGDERKLAIALFQNVNNSVSNLLPIDRGDRDWNSKRLILPLIIK